jgi:hypothetical protein
MALLAGAHLASHSLQLTQGSERLLPEIYPQVPHIQRFNLLTTKARELLNDAEEHLGAMAVPYVLAIHEDFVLTALRLLGNTGDTTASSMHRRLAATCPVNYGPAFSSFHAARTLRNAIIHNGGVWNDRSVAEAKRDIDAAHIAEWVKHTNRSPLNLHAGARVTIGNGELVATLSATKSLARAINHALQAALTRDQWADLLIEDIRVSEPGHLANHHRARKCIGYSRHRYSPLKLSADEINQALTRAGY